MALPLQNMSGLDEDELQRIYTWIDDIPLSRPKRNITRDFSDGVLMAEVVKHFFPKVVELHNYSAANSTQQKMYNWNTLRNKVFKKIAFSITDQDVDDIVQCVPGAVERVLKALESKVAKYRAKKLAEARKEALGIGRSSSSFQSPAMDVSASPVPSSFVDRYGHSSPKSSYQEGVNTSFDQIALQKEVDSELLLEKEATIRELRDTIEILEGKIKKLEQLVRIKDARLEALMKKQETEY